MPLETIVYVSVLTAPARTPDGVTEFTAMLRRQMQVLDITGAFTTCDNLGVHVAQGRSASIDRLMVLVAAGFWQTGTGFWSERRSRPGTFSVGAGSTRGCSALRCSGCANSWRTPPRPQNRSGPC